jgi:hypothetical protein
MRRARMAEAVGMQAEGCGLFTAPYQSTMAQSSLEHDKHRPATRSLIVRTLPPDHVSLVATGCMTVTMSKPPCGSSVRTSL